MVISKPQPSIFSKTELSKMKVGQSVLVTIGSSLTFGLLGYFISQRRIGIAVTSAVVGGALGFLVDAKIQRIKRKVSPNTK